MNCKNRGPGLPGSLIDYDRPPSVPPPSESIAGTASQLHSYAGHSHLSQYPPPPPPHHGYHQYPPHYQPVGDYQHLSNSDANGADSGHGSYTYGSSGQAGATTEPMIAAQNLTFLKMGTTPPSGKKRPVPDGSGASGPDLSSMPSLTSSEGTSPGNEGIASAAAGTPTTKKNQDKVKGGDEANALLIAARAMTDLGQSPMSGSSEQQQQQQQQDGGTAQPETDKIPPMKRSKSSHDEEEDNGGAASGRPRDLFSQCPQVASV